MLCCLAVALLGGARRPSLDASALFRFRGGRLTYVFALRRVKSAPPLTCTYPHSSSPHPRLVTHLTTSTSLLTSRSGCSRFSELFHYGRRKGEEGRGPGAGLDSDRLGWSGRASTPRRGPTIVEGNSARGRTNQSSEPAGRWDPEGGPCETDDVMWTEFGGLGDPAGREGG